MLNPLTRKVTPPAIYRPSLSTPFPSKSWNPPPLGAPFLASDRSFKRSRRTVRQLASTQSLLLLALLNIILLATVASFNIWNRDTVVLAQTSVHNLLLVPTASLFDLTRDFSQAQQWKNESILFHTVALGDGVGLSSLALQYNVTVDTLLTVNNLSSLEASVGRDQLRVPVMNGLQISVPLRRSVAWIAKKYNVSEDKLRSVNHLTSDTVAPKSTLFIPDASLSAGKKKRMVGNAFFYPVFGTLAQEFGWQEDAVTGLLHSYSGVAFTTEAGASVVASKAGRVSSLGIHPFYGLHIIVDHSDGLQTMYGRLETSSIKMGQSVVQGELLGRVKAGGYRGKGLFYFSLLKNGLPENPLHRLR